MATPRGALSMMGLPDPRQKTSQQDFLRLLSDYIMTGNKPVARQIGPSASAASSEPGWGEPSEISDEEEISPDKGQLVEVDEEEEKPAAAAAEEEAAIEEDAGEEAVDAAGPLSSVPARNTYENEILSELEAAKAELLQQKRLSIADILGAGNIRKSAQLIRETEALNEQRKMKARELALDILMRKSASEEKRQAAEETAKYRQELLNVRRLAAMKGPEEVDKQVRSRAKAMFPNLSPEAAYQKYVRDILNRPPAGPRPQPERYDITIAKLQEKEELHKEGLGPPLTKREKFQIENYLKLDPFQRLIEESYKKAKGQ